MRDGRLRALPPAGEGWGAPGERGTPSTPRHPCDPPQWLLGCGFFLLPRASFSLRSRYKPQHVFFGIALFALSIAACLLGITEMLLFNIKWVTELSPPPDSPTPSKGLFQSHGAESGPCAGSVATKSPPGAFAAAAAAESLPR